MTAVLAACALLIGMLAALPSIPNTRVQAVTNTWNYGYSGLCTTAAQIDAAFPASYASNLKALLAAHPNWRFKAFYTGLAWEDCFKHDADYQLNTEMYVSRNLIEYDSMPSSWYSTEVKGSFNWAGNCYTVMSAPNWIQASEEAIRYMMDPRNWMNEEQIFQFMDQTATSSLYAVQQVLAQVRGSDFWIKPADQTGIYVDESLPAGPVPGIPVPVYSDDAPEGDAGITVIEKRNHLTYAEALVKIGETLGVNPVALATRVTNEQGPGNSPLISGTQAFVLESGEVIPGGYYNYFNIGAFDGAEGPSMERIITNGLREAYQGGWDTRYRALYGGAAKYAAMYIRSGQPTIYQQKYSVDSRSSKLFWQQYMQAIMAPSIAARANYNSYRNAGLLDDCITFQIPVFDQMPDSPEPRPTKNGNPNYKLGAIYVNDSSVPNFNTDVLEYYTEVKKGTAHMYISAYADTSTISTSETSARGTLITDVPLDKGENIFKIACTAENGDTRVYTLHISWIKTLYYGDINYDGIVDEQDMNLLSDYILGKVILDADMLEAADINGDGAADVKDLSIIVAYILGNIDEIPQR